MSVGNYTLSTSSLKDLPFDKYGRDFTFIVDDKRYSTSRFVADLLSPMIRNNHYNDPSNNEFEIKTIKTNTIQEEENKTVDYFSEFLELSRFEERTIDSKRRERYSEFFLQLGNINEYMRLQEETKNETSSENKSVEHLQKLTVIDNNDEINEENEIIKHHIKMIVDHFSSVDKEKLKNIKIEFIEKIISDKNLKIHDEDELFEFVLEMYEQNHINGFLFEYVLFCNISEENMSKFIEKFEIEDMNVHVWHSICGKLCSTFRKQRENECKEESRYKTNSMKFEYSKGKEFDGIINYLTKKTCGNVHDNGTIIITTNNLNSNAPPKNLVDYGKDNYFNPRNTDLKGSFVCFDFKDKLVQLTSYSIKSHFCLNLRNWKVEVSKEGKTWETVDNHVDDSTLKKTNTISTFNISPSRTDFYRFIRLTETGCCWFDTTRYDGTFSKIEFFGQLQEPSSQ